MQFRRRSSRRVAINITSMIDILFLLIIFFVVTSTFLDQPGMRLELPSAESAEPEELDELVVDIDQDGGLVLSGRTIGVTELLEELSARIAERTESSRALVIRADQAAAHGQVVQVMDIARQAGVADLVIATEAQPRGGR